MTMKQTINLNDFRDAFRAHDRQDQFTYEGLEVLFDALTDMERDTGEEIELDVIALCCEFSEDAPAEIAENYSIDISECEDDDEIRETVREYLGENTWVAGETDQAFIYQAF
jgi:hypothetical protein